MLGVNLCYVLQCGNSCFCISDTCPGGDNATSTQLTTPGTAGMESDGLGLGFIKKILHPRMTNSYKMNPIKGDKKRGLALIFNNVKFDKLNERKSSDKDAENLRQTLQFLGYDVRSERNRTVQEMQDLIELAIQKDIKGAHDSVIICFLSHGCREGIYGVDDSVLPVEKFSTPLNNKNCGALFGKPKIFFIQACRGDAIPEMALKEKDTTLMEGDRPGDELTCELPPDSDFFFSYSTVPDTSARRHKVQGSIYVQELCSVLKKHSHEYSLEEMIMLLNFEITEQGPVELEKTKNYLQIGQVVHTLRGPVYFMWYSLFSSAINVVVH